MFLQELDMCRDKS